MASELSSSNETLISGLPRDVHDDEGLVRFLVQRSHFNAIMVKPALFLPSTRDKETSVFRHGKEPHQQLCKIGREAAGSRTLYGAAIVKAQTIRSLQLDVVADEPPPRHAAIRGWPFLENDPELQKARQMEIAAQIASAAGTPILLDGTQ